MKKLLYILFLLSSIVFAQPTGGTGIRPESYLADGATDYTSALISAFQDGIEYGQKVVLTPYGSYNITGQIPIDMSDGNLTIEGNNATIVSTYTISNTVYYAFWCGSWINYPSTGAVYSSNGTNRFTVVYSSVPHNERISEYVLMQKTAGTGPALHASGTLTRISGTGEASYSFSDVFNGQAYIPIGAMHFTNGNRLHISDLTFQADTGDGFVRLEGSYLSGIVFDDIQEVILDNYHGNLAPYAVALVNDVEKFAANNSIFEHGLFSGLTVHQSKHVNLFGSQFNYNGNIPFVNGYGLNIGTESGFWDITQNISVIGCKALYNTRKGLDFHGGRKILVDGNFIKGYVAIGIGLTNIEDTVYNEDGRREYTSNAIITNNIIENDSAWISTLSLPNTANMYSIGLQMGTYGDDDLDSAGTWIAAHNIFRNYSIYKQDTLETDWAIHSWAGHSKIIQIKNNAFESGTTNSAIIGISSGNDSLSYGQVEVADISGNVGTNCNSDYFILVTAGENLSVTFNSFRGGSVNDYGLGIMNTHPGSNIDAYNEFGNFFPNLTYAKQIFIQDGLGTENKSFTSRYLSMYYDNGIRGGIGVESPEFAWDVLGNIRAQYDFIAGKSGLASGRLYLVKSADGTNGVALRASDVNEFGNSVIVTGDVDVSGSLKVNGTAHNHDSEYVDAVGTSIIMGSDGNRYFFNGTAWVAYP